MGFLMKTDPYPHQAEALEVSADREYFALLMSMRTGKSKVIIDTGTHLYGRGRIDALVVVAPKGVHRNWVVEAVRDHLPDEVPRVCAYWQGNNTKAKAREWELLYQADSLPLRVIAFNYDAIIHPKGKAEFKRALTTFRCLLVGDESHRFKSPDATRTKVMWKAAELAPYRRILTGTFLTQGPLDTYAQLKFLDPSITGFSAFATFRSHYAVTEAKLLANGRERLGRWLARQGIDPGAVDVTAFASAANLKHAGCRPGRDYYEHVSGYQRLPELHAAVAPHAYLLRAEDAVDLPPKVYETVPVELTAEQKRMYNQLLRESVAQLTGASDAPPPDGLDDDDLFMWFLTGGAGQVVASNAMVKHLRLQQIAGGFVTTVDENGVIVEEGIPVKSNRLGALLELLDGTDGKVLVWARFRAELQAITEALRKEYGEDAVVRYYGGVGDEERAAAVHRLEHDPACRFFVGNPQSGGIGLPLHAADTMVYYSRDFNLETYLQSEERASKVGKSSSVLIVDLSATGTIDEKIAAALREKRAGADEFYAGVKRL